MMTSDETPPSTMQESHPGIEPEAGDVTAMVELQILEKRISLQLTVNSGLTTARDLLPIAQGLTQIASELASLESEANGKPVSCRAGCGACCRQLVPITQPEAHQLRALLSAMPETAQLEIKRRFADASSKLREADMLQTLSNGELWSHVKPTEFADAYFRLGIACPFLENESCSIHQARPMVCRAYSVTSPAENCQNPTPGNIVMLQHPLPRPSEAFSRAMVGAAEGTSTPWVPLILALDYASSSSEPAAQYTGPHLLSALLEAMTGAEMPEAAQA